MTKLYNSAQVAELTGRVQDAVNLIARRHGIGVKVGRDWVFTAEDVEAIRQIPRKGGRPPKRQPPAP